MQMMGQRNSRARLRTRRSIRKKDLLGIIAGERFEKEKMAEHQQKLAGALAKARMEEDARERMKLGARIKDVARFAMGKLRAKFGSKLGRG